MMKENYGCPFEKKQTNYVVADTTEGDNGSVSEDQIDGVLDYQLAISKKDDEEKLIVERDGFKGFFFILLIFFHERINYYEMIL